MSMGPRSSKAKRSPPMAMASRACVAPLTCMRMGLLLDSMRLAVFTCGCASTSSVSKVRPHSWAGGSWLVFGWAVGAGKGVNAVAARMACYGWLSVLGAYGEHRRSAGASAMAAAAHTPGDASQQTGVLHLAHSPMAHRVAAVG